jgi:tetratricopeptide (TPR) repeat protein
MKKCFGFRLKFVVLAAVAGALFCGALTPAFAQKKPQSKEEIEARIKELERKKQDEQKKRIQVAEANKPKDADLEAIIVRYEKLLEQCAVKKSDRCADVMYTLGSLYYDQGRDDFGKASERHADALKQYDRTGRGSPPAPPIPDYSKSLKMYWQLTREYPTFPKLPEAFFQMSQNYLVAGHLDTTRIILEQLVQRFPNSPRVSAAQFRLGELAFMDNNFNKAYEHFKKAKAADLDIVSREMLHYRLAECAYNIGDFDKAVDYFHSYVEACDRNEYQKKEFREMALEYMAISFSDMPEGVDVAIKFFKKNKGKSYEPTVIYMVGTKNREHGQWDAAIKALEGALKSYPMYKEAPLARQRLIECYVVKKEHEKANKERESLVDDYGEGSKWYTANSRERVVIDKAGAEVRRALGQIAIYYHGEAQRKKDRSFYDKAMKRYNEFFTKFPNDKWRVFEYKYNVAEIYNNMGDCGKAAENYRFVAEEDVSKYPAFVNDIDTLGMDAEELEKLKATKGDKTNPIAISQEDAGYNVIVSLETCRKKEMAKESISEDKSYGLASTKKLLDYAMTFNSRFPKSANAADVLYLAGNIHYGGKNYGDAVTAFKMALDNYPNAKIAPNIARMLGNSYSNNNQFDLAMQTFKALLSRTARETKDYEEITELAAGAMYRNAENMKKSGNLAGAAAAFQAISGEFREGKVAEKGWFEAGVCFEEMNDLDRAAAVFEQMPDRFPKGAMREISYIRAAENYKKAGKFDKAATIYLTAANQIPKAEFAIPSLSSASECYQKLSQYDMAGKMFEYIYERYANDPKTPGALYNAGLIFEKGKHYSNAINVYETMASRYPNSEFASEAFFSIGLCYEKLEEFGKMANSFSDYADKYTADRAKQVQALVKAGDAYFNMQNYDESKKNYDKAVKIYEQHSKTSSIDEANVAQSYFRVGEIYYKKFEDIKLTAKNEKEMGGVLKTKTKALEDPAKYFAKAIELGVEEWTMRATHMIGKGFYDMAEAVANQTLFGNETEKMAGKIKVLSSLDKYYDKAMEYFGQNIAWAKEQNLKGEYIELSMQAMMEMAFRKGDILEQVGLLFKNSPVPKELTGEDREFYVMELEERYLKALDAAMPVYENGMKMAKEIGIANSPWLDRIRERLAAINPESEWKDIQIVEWKPTERPKQYDAEGNEIAPKGRDPEFDRVMKRIAGIINQDTNVDEKIKQLNRIQMDAERNIVLEEQKISDLKAKSGS